ncbi:MAG: hypothetical protein IT438_05970, partial [Phycisphaerales bacterium]|nr:hypothetical protein [Phycisphaerales bacterium]
QFLQVDLDKQVRLAGDASSHATIFARHAHPVAPSRRVFFNGLLLQAVTAVGNIAGDVIAEGNSIAEVASTSGNISGAITATAGTVLDVFALNGTISGAISSNRGMISSIKAKNITGSITANGQFQPLTEFFAINTIEATEDIGTSSQPITITTDAGPVSVGGQTGFNNGSIKRVFGRNIFANITTPFPENAPAGPYTADNKRGNIRELKTTGLLSAGHGKFGGSVTTFTLGDLDTPLVNALQLTGNLEGTITAYGTIKRPVIIGGDIVSTATLELVGEEQDLSATGDITISGTLVGAVSVAGDKLGDLIINPGSMTGTINVGGNLQSKLSIGGTVTSTAKIIIDQNVEARYNNATPPVQQDTIVFTGASAMAGQLWIGHNLSGVVVMPLFVSGTQTGGLSGQVIINRNDEAGAFETATARVRIGQTNQSGWQNIASPEYPLLSSPIGGGAVGLAPFKLHKLDCVPVYVDNPAGQPPVLLSTGFLPAETRPPNLSEAVVTIQSRGPMKIDTENGYTATNAVIIEVQNPACPTQWWPATDFFTRTYAPGGNARVLQLTRVSGGPPREGVYRVIPQGLICKDMAGSIVLPVDWPITYVGGSDDELPAYVFRVGADCNGNGIWDVTDIADGLASDPQVILDSDSDGIIDDCEEEEEVCRCDWNESGVVSVQDIFDFLASYFAGNGDFNQSGASSVQDIFDFLGCYFGLPEPCCGI